MAVQTLSKAGWALGFLSFVVKRLLKRKTVVSQQVDDSDWRGQLKPAQEADPAFIAHVTADAQEHLGKH